MLFSATGSTASCVSTLAVLFVVVGLILWRLEFHYSNHSHLRRLLFHMILLGTIALQTPFWGSRLSTSSQEMYAVGVALLIVAKSLMLVCVLIIIFQWAHVLSAGLVQPGQAHYGSKGRSLLPLLVLHMLEVSASVGFSLVMLLQGPPNVAKISDYLNQNTQYTICLSITLATATLDALVIMSIVVKLIYRLVSSDMAANMKKKTICQIASATCIILLMVLAQLIMNLPICLLGVSEAWSSLDFAQYVQLSIGAPTVLATTSFLYLMRRKEAKKPEQVVGDTVVMSPQPRCRPIASIRVSYTSQRETENILHTPVFGDMGFDSPQHSDYYGTSVDVSVRSSINEVV